MELRKGDKFKFTYDLKKLSWIYNEILDIKIYTKDELNHPWKIGKTCCLVVDRKKDGTEMGRMWLEVKMLEDCINHALKAGHTFYLGNIVEDRNDKIYKILK